MGTAQAKVTIAGLDHTWTATNAGDDSWVAVQRHIRRLEHQRRAGPGRLGSARQWGGVLIDLVEIISCADGGCEIAVPEVSSFSPASGYVGDAVTITGSNFTDAVSVSFNGTDASIFTVVSDTEITATVPGGATTGAITVATASASGASSSDFEVVDSGSPNLIVQGDFEGEPLADDGGWISYFEGREPLRCMGSGERIDRHPSLSPRKRRCTDLPRCRSAPHRPSRQRRGRDEADYRRDDGGPEVPALVHLRDLSLLRDHGGECECTDWAGWEYAE